MSNVFSCERDKEEFKKILGYNLQLVCGKLCDGNSTQIIKLQRELLSSIKSIEILPSGPNEFLDKQRMNGCNSGNALNGTSEIKMKGFCNSPEYRYSNIQHTFSHEIFHSIYCFLNRSKDGKDLQGNRLMWFGQSNGEKIIGGGAFLVSFPTAKPYGKLFQETLMDIKASMAFAEFDKDYQMRNPGVTADTILCDDVSRWGDGTITSYIKMIPLTQLMIAAFANEPNINYHKWIQEGQPIERLLSLRKNRETMYANDFLYGMMYDPTHIMEEYDKYMGEGAYIELLKITDEIYQKCLEQDRIDAQLAKKAMSLIANFANRRTTALKNNGVLSDGEICKLSGNFNKIWNRMSKEYNVNYTADELDKLYE